MSKIDEKAFNVAYETHGTNPWTEDEIKRAYAFVKAYEAAKAMGGATGAAAAEGSTPSPSTTHQPVEYPEKIWAWRHGDDEPFNGMFLECNDSANPGVKYVRADSIMRESINQVMLETLQLIARQGAGAGIGETWAAEKAKEALSRTEKSGADDNRRRS